MAHAKLSLFVRSCEGTWKSESAHKHCTKGRTQERERVSKHAKVRQKRPELLESAFSAANFAELRHDLHLAYDRKRARP